MEKKIIVRMEIMIIIRKVDISKTKRDKQNKHETKIFHKNNKNLYCKKDNNTS